MKGEKSEEGELVDLLTSQLRHAPPDRMVSPRKDTS